MNAPFAIDRRYAHPELAGLYFKPCSEERKVNKLSESIMLQIEKMEQEADNIVKDASRQAREMVQSVDEACMARERAATRDIRDEAQRMLEERRQSVQGEIKLLNVRRAAEREAMCKEARQRVNMAADLIFERIVNNGDR